MAEGHASDAPRGAIQAGAGALSGLDDLYRRHFTTLSAFVRRKFGPGPPDPEDVAQAAFERFAALTDQAQVRNPKAFLYRCARNYVIDHRRRQAVSTRLASEVQSLNPTGASADGDPLRVLEAREDLAAVIAAIEALDARRREVLILNSIEGLSCAEIARRMGLSQTRIVQLYAQAIAACAKALSEAQGGRP
jgi:RNA polymerase sigma-70 factor (ECF subfamily)